MKTKDKEFDCVRMARECNERVSRILNAMTAEEQIGFLEKFRRGGSTALPTPPEAPEPAVVREEEREWVGKRRMASRVLRLYIDTSVVGGYFDDEWREATRELWRQWREGRWVFVTSVVTSLEIEKAPEQVAELFAETFPEDSRLPLTIENRKLAQAYIDAGVVTPRYEDDARHVAVCSAVGCDFLVSWNFRHLANVRREAGFNEVNLLQGYGAVRIVSPLELIFDDENEN